MTAAEDREPLAYKPAVAASAVGVSKSRIYELIHAGEIPAVRVGGRMLIRREALVDWLDRQPEVEAS